MIWKKKQSNVNNHFLKVVKYDESQRFNMHYDYFQSTKYVDNQRKITILAYLSDKFEEVFIDYSNELIIIFIFFFKREKQALEKLVFL